MLREGLRRDRAGRWPRASWSHLPRRRLTTDGEINEFRAASRKILERTPVPVIPMALPGLWAQPVRAQPCPPAACSQVLFNEEGAAIGQPAAPAAAMPRNGIPKGYLRGEAR